jgi:hypothetical protein
MASCQGTVRLEDRGYICRKGFVVDRAAVCGGAAAIIAFLAASGK